MDARGRVYNHNVKAYAQGVNESIVAASIAKRQMAVSDEKSIREEREKEKQRVSRQGKIEIAKNLEVQNQQLQIAEDDRGCPGAFMGIKDGTLEMLFISPEERGKGLGKRLLQYGIKTYAVERVAVNEQNPQAKGFYEHMGFQVYKRTDLDEQGNPYPLLYMSLNI